jgi:hypothetical protein
MAVASMQRPTTPSSFSDNKMGNNPDFPFPPMSEHFIKHRVQGFTFFKEDNQWPWSEYVLNDLWSSRAIPQDKPIELEEYKGFKLAEWGDILVSYSKEGFVLLRNFKFVCLERQTHNDFYPDPYLVICFELELEGSGESKEAALDDLFQLLDLYLDRTREICENLEEYTDVITAKINQQNHWKQFFFSTYRWAQKQEVLNADHVRKIT